MLPILPAMKNSVVKVNNVCRHRVDAGDTWCRISIVTDPGFHTHICQMGTPVHLTHMIEVAEV